MIFLRGLLFSEQKLWREDLGKTGGRSEDARRGGREDYRRGVRYERKKERGSSTAQKNSSKHLSKHKVKSI